MAVMLSILRMLSLWKTIINHGLLTIKAPSSAKSLLSSYSSELPDEQEEFDVKIKWFFTRKCTTIMKDQSDVYHYMNPSKNAPHFDELLNGKDLYYLEFRVLKIKTGDNTYEYIITNLPYSFDINDIKDCYHWRWGIIPITVLFPLCRYFINADIFQRANIMKWHF